MGLPAANCATYRIGEAASLGEKARDPLWLIRMSRCEWSSFAGPRMFTRLPVVDSDTGQLAGMISLHDLLMARVRNLSEERHRERVLQLRLPFGNRAKLTNTQVP